LHVPCVAGGEGGTRELTMKQPQGYPDSQWYWPQNEWYWVQSSEETLTEESVREDSSGCTARFGEHPQYGNALFVPCFEQEGRLCNATIAKDWWNKNPSDWYYIAQLRDCREIVGWASGL